MAWIALRNSSWIRASASGESDRSGGIGLLTMPGAARPRGPSERKCPAWQNGVDRVAEFFLDPRQRFGGIRSERRDRATDNARRGEAARPVRTAVSGLAEWRGSRCGILPGSAPALRGNPIGAAGSGY